MQVHDAWPSHTSDPLVHHGRHFGRTIYAMCNIQALVMNGMLLLDEDMEVTEKSLTAKFVSPFPS
jgi:hypothetical protein